MCYIIILVFYTKSAKSDFQGKVSENFMTVNIITEPEYENTVWCKETLCGLLKKAAHLRCKRNFLTEDKINENIEILVIIGTSPVWVSAVIKKCRHMA